MADVAGVEATCDVGCVGATRGGVCAAGGATADTLASTTGAPESIRAGAVATGCEDSPIGNGAGVACDTDKDD